MDPVLLFSKATARGCDVMAGVSVGQRALSTPCPDWSPLGFDWTAQDRLLGAMGRQP